MYIHILNNKKRINRTQAKHMFNKPYLPTLDHMHYIESLVQLAHDALQEYYFH